MSDWKEGDLALCVRTRLGRWRQDPHPCEVGRIYEVERIVPTKNEGLGLGLVNIVFPNCFLNADTEKNYRKVTPEKADEFDREVIFHMQNQRITQ